MSEQTKISLPDYVRQEHWLNVLVAEKVCGWVLDGYNAHTGTPVYKQDEHRHAVVLIGGYSSNSLWGFNPTEDIPSAFWAAGYVFNFPNGDRRCEFELKYLNRTPAWRAEFSNELQGWDSYIAYADTPSMAICLAALRVRGITV